MNKFDKMFSDENFHLSLNNFVDVKDILLDQNGGTEILVDRIFSFTKHEKNECSFSLKKMFAKESGILCGKIKTPIANYNFIVSIIGRESFFFKLNNKNIKNQNYGNLILWKETQASILENVVETIDYIDVVEKVNSNILKLNESKLNLNLSNVLMRKLKSLEDKNTFNLVDLPGEHLLLCEEILKNVVSTSESNTEVYREVISIEKIDSFKKIIPLRVFRFYTATCLRDKISILKVDSSLLMQMESGNSLILTYEDLINLSFVGNSSLQEKYLLICGFDFTSFHKTDDRNVQKSIYDQTITSTNPINLSGLFEMFDYSKMDDAEIESLLYPVISSKLNVCGCRVSLSRKIDVSKSRFLYFENEENENTILLRCLVIFNDCKINDLQVKSGDLIFLNTSIEKIKIAKKPQKNNIIIYEFKLQRNAIR
jgi:hypothetical protein